MKAVLMPLLSILMMNGTLLYSMNKQSGNTFYKSIENKRLNISSTLDQWSRQFNNGAIIMARFKPLIRALIATVFHSESLSFEQKEHAIQLIEKSIENNFLPDELIYQEYNDQGCQKILLNIVENLMNKEYFNRSDALSFSDQIKEQAQHSVEYFQDDEDVQWNLEDLLEINLTNDTSEMCPIYEYLKDIISARYQVEYHVNAARRSRLNAKPPVEQRCLPH